MPDEPLFALRPMARRDTPAVRRLWSKRFGGEPDTQDAWIAAALDSTHPVVGLAADVPSEEGLLGFSFLDVAGPEHTREYLGLDRLGLDPPLNEQNGIFHLSCVRADWEGRGIGSSFFQRRLEILSTRNVPVAFGIAWHRPDCSHDSRALFKKWGFDAFATIDRYYHRTESRPHCPVCEDACTCTASLYLRVEGIG